MAQSIPGFIIGFREGLEAFLVIGIILQYLSKINQNKLRGSVYQGSIAGIFLSIMLGFVLNSLTKRVEGVESLTQVWESASSLVALVLITPFILWMIRHNKRLTQDVHTQVTKNLSWVGVFFVSMVIISREGAEIAIFAFAGKYPNVSVLLGVFIAFILALMLYFSLIKVSMSLILRITLAYLILQAGFLLGYAIHEGLSAMKEYGILAHDAFVFAKAFDLSKTVFNHKDGVIGFPLYILTGWYSKPEWIQFLIQYLYTITMFVFWYFDDRKIIPKKTTK